jgi:hypothetical protein
MTEATSPPEETEEGQPRDAAYWAQKVEKLEVSKVPTGAANVNVQGRREVGPLQGFGKLWQKTYRVRMAGVAYSAPRSKSGSGRTSSSRSLDTSV